MRRGPARPGRHRTGTRRGAPRPAASTVARSSPPASSRAAWKPSQNPASMPRQAQRPAGDPVEVRLHRRREAVFHPPAEERLQECGRDPAPLGRHEAPVVDDRVVALLQHRDDRRPGRRPPDAELLQPAHQPRLGVARRRLGDMAHRPRPGHGHGRAFRQRRQGAPGAVSLIVPFAVAAPGAEVAVEGGGGPLRRQFDAAGVRPGRRGEPDPHPVDPGGRHLARQRAPPDQPVEPRRGPVEAPLDILRRAREPGRPDRHVRFRCRAGAGLPAGPAAGACAASPGGSRPRSVRAPPPGPPPPRSSPSPCRRCADR